MSASDLCPVTGKSHNWYAPVRQYRPRNSGEHYSYHVPGQQVRAATVRCWDCQRWTPVGERSDTARS